MSRKGLNIYKRKDGRWEARYIKSRTAQGKPLYGYLYGENEVEGGVRVTHNQEQYGLFIPDGVQLHFIVLHQFPHLPDVKWG